jgi:hypothetical protein
MDTGQEADARTLLTADTTRRGLGRWIVGKCEFEMEDQKTVADWLLHVYVFAGMEAHWRQLASNQRAEKVRAEYFAKPTAKTATQTDDAPPPARVRHLPRPPVSKELGER